MLQRALASIAFEVGDIVGDTSSAFITRVQRFLNNRYSDVLMRSCATMWTMASRASLGSTDIPTLGMGEIIQAGATADAWETKRQFSKAAKYEQKYDFMLGNFIISGDNNRILASFDRYDFHDD